MNLPDPTNHRISNSLFDAINKVRNGESAEAQQLEEGNDGNLANNAKPYDKVTRGDVIAGRLGKDEMGGKKKVKEEAEEVAEDVASGQVAEPKTPIEMPNKMHNANDSVKAKAMKKVAAAANKGVKEEAEEVAEARSTGTAFDMSTPSQIKKKPGELTGHSMKKSEAGGRIYTKNAPKMPQDTGVPHKSKSMKEGISQTVINHNDFVLEVTDNPTYGDYLKALQSMINNNDEQIQQELITIAQEAYKQNIDAIIIEASARATFRAKLQELRTSGAKVLDENYIVESGEPYVEYVVEQDGVRKQYVHSGTVKKV
jgi:hypothetical protein